MGLYRHSSRAAAPLHPFGGVGCVNGEGREALEANYCGLVGTPTEREDQETIIT